MYEFPSRRAHAPIFILGAPRSGTTLLRYVIDTHPQICCPPEMQLGKLTRHVLQVLAVVKQRATPTETGPFDPDSVAHARSLMDGMMAIYCAHTGKAMWCEKTPSNVEYLPQLKAVFPDARWVCVYRHALDVVHSAIEYSMR